MTDFSYSWFDFKVKEKALGDQLPTPTSPNKLSAGLTYNGGRFSGSAIYRWVDGFRWAAGVFVGDVPSYDLIDLGANYRISDALSFGVNVTNLLDDEHFQ